MALAIVNTILGGSTGGIAVLLLTKFKWIAKNFVRTSISIYCQKSVKEYQSTLSQAKHWTVFFSSVPEAKGRARKMELPTHPQWSSCGHGELFIDPDGIISFFLANPCHFIALSVPNCTKNTQPSMTWAHCTFGNVSSASTLASRHSNNILLALFEFVERNWMM